MRNSFHLLGVLIPTLILFVPLSWGNLFEVRSHEESFASRDFYITFQKKHLLDPQEFSAIVTTDTSEEKVTGRLVKNSLGGTVYTFSFSGGFFSGLLQKVNSQKGCEPEMDYVVRKDGKLVKSGRLKGAFCAKQNPGV